MPLNLPNFLTVARIVLIFITLVLATNSTGTPVPGGIKVTLDSTEILLRYIAYGLAILAGITDLVDGHLARKWNQVTDFGALMDPLADKIFVTVTILVLVEFQLVAAWVAAVVIAREFMVTGLRTLAVSKGRVISADKWGKLKTALQMLMLFVGGLIWIGVLNVDTVLAGTVTLKLVWSMLLWGIVIVTVGSGVGYFVRNRDLVLEQ